MYTQTVDVATPCGEYELWKSTWIRNAAIIAGEKATKSIDVAPTINSILIPFSGNMTLEQYNLFKMEAELPGINSQFAAMLRGGMLRKPPIVESKDTATQEWISEKFTSDNQSIITFLSELITEEIATQRAWVLISYPDIGSGGNAESAYPYPICYKALDVINWEETTDSNGVRQLSMAVIKASEPSEEQESAFHTSYDDTYRVHRLDDEGYYEIAVYDEAGEVLRIHDNIYANDERLTSIPLYTANGSIDVIKPILNTLIDKEVSLYNKASRRNHLLLGAATFTPIVHSDMGEDSFKAIVAAGLGSWIQVGIDDKVDTLKTPTEALSDLADSISEGYSEIARLGVRMLAPEKSDVSGVALKLRSANQDVTIGNLAVILSKTVEKVIDFMVYWKTGEESGVSFRLNDDFQLAPLGYEYIKLMTEWYESKLIPRSLWMTLIKDNELIPAEYNDTKGVTEINGDETTLPKDNYEL